VTDERLAEIEARCNDATPGPWSAVRDHNGHWRVVWPHSQNGSVARDGKVFDDYDAAFIAAARDDVPDLLAEVRRLRGAMDEVRRRIETSARCGRTWPDSELHLLVAKALGGSP
jgi:hypothetical protein